MRLKAVLGIMLTLLLIGILFVSVSPLIAMVFGTDSTVITSAQLTNESMEWCAGYASGDDCPFDTAYSVIQTSDGGYALAGVASSELTNRADFWLVKTDWTGGLVWSKTYGGPGNEYACSGSLVQTSDGGYVLAGCTDSYGAGGSDFWLIKTDWTGDVVWSKTYGGTGSECIFSMVQTCDGGYALAGYTDSYGAGGIDFWLVKIDSAGNLQWNKTYGGTDADNAYSLVQTTDGGYALAGETGYDFDYGIDFWLVKTDSAGNLQWNKTYGGNGLQYANSLVQTSDGGYVLAGGSGQHFRYFFLVKVRPDEPPHTTDDYDGLWKTANFAVKLTATDDFTGVSDTYYKINDGTLTTVNINGQPTITTEGADNKLEYWSVDSLGNTELPHNILTGIKLDKTAPTGLIVINSGEPSTISTSVMLSLTYSDAASGVSKVRYSNDGVWDTEVWETPSATKAWTLTSGYGTKTVCYQIKDNAGLLSSTYSDTISVLAPPEEYELTVSVDGSGSTSPAVGIHSYEEGSEVAVSAHPSSGWAFNHWLLDSVDVGSANPYTVTMDENHSLTVVFTEIPPEEYDLTLAVTGSGSTSPSVGVHTYTDGTNVSVTATPSAGWNFSHWLLDSVNVGSNNPYTVTMNSNKTLTVVFTEIPSDNGEPSFEETTIHVYFEQNVYIIKICSNSNVSEFDFNQALKKIRFNANGTSGTTGLCNVTFPSELMWGDFSIYKGDTLLIENVDYIGTYNGTHYLFSIMYEHSTHTIEIIATEVVPEFPSFVILPLFMIATLLAVTVYRRKHTI